MKRFKKSDSNLKIREPIVFIAFLFLVSCAVEEVKDDQLPFELSEKEKRQYFVDSIAYQKYNGSSQKQVYSLNNVDTFFLKAYGIKTNYWSNTCVLYALEENFVDTSKIDSSINFLRISVNPSFRFPYVLLLKQENNRNSLTGKTTDGYGFYSGYLDLTVEQKVSEKFVNQIFERLEELNFFDLPPKIEVKGDDGENWYIEFMKNGQYHSISRFTPNSIGDSVAREIGELGLELLDKNKLFQYWVLQNDSSYVLKK